nr:immunoglobulin light chain junction region [Macaca mulatta]MPN65998.1 immunoglobulin light chain junction region [Macaca mulatta]MPN66274.1 immunoglobulin light chain junction region [Macaca mulatta]MPN66294.1 immunoglobulin light chain junction region [Macaca mulatta]MPN66490.1 immunoglobulin light chain junction region [Macaca mulatta]
CGAWDSSLSTGLF